MNNRFSLLRFSILCSLFGCPLISQAEQLQPANYKPSQTDFGGVGLMQMPSARMAAEGEFSFGTSFNPEYHHYAVSMQLMPWLETTIRYTQMPDLKFNPNYAYSGDTYYTDKGIDFKVRLWQEGYWLPEAALGIRDIGGTGKFDGEYLALSKRYHNLDFTLGLGWGYLGQRGNVSDPCHKPNSASCDRDPSFKDKGGSIDYSRWFKGNMAIYAGLEYQTPHQPLRLKLEYDGNDYSDDSPNQVTDMTQHTPWNFGAHYQLNDWAELKVSYQRGDTLTFGFTLFNNFDALKNNWRDSLPIAPAANIAEPSAEHWQAVSDLLAENAGYREHQISMVDDTLVIRGQQSKYRDRQVALERAAAIVSPILAEDVRYLQVQETSAGLESRHFDVELAQYQAQHQTPYLQSQFSDALIDRPLINTDNTATVVATEKSWNAGFTPVLQQSVGSPESFYFYNIGLLGSANYWLMDNLEISGGIYINLLDNFDKFNYTDKDPHINNFAVPRVRTMHRAYVHDNPVRLNQLQLTWFTQPFENVYSQFYGGYLEYMYAGVGSEWLYRQADANWAIGFDANLVSQRRASSWFGTHRDDFYFYDGFDASNCQPEQVHCQAYVLDQGFTGQITAYYQPRWSLLEDTMFKVSAGQFLAGDKGVKVDFSKQFDSGVIVGAYAAKTNLTAEEYGEGSFTKGFYISIPFDLITVKPSTGRGYFGWQPLTRDGGQVLDRKYELFNVTDGQAPWLQRPIATAK